MKRLTANLLSFTFPFLCTLILALGCAAKVLDQPIESDKAAAETVSPRNGEQPFPVISITPPTKIITPSPRSPLKAKKPTIDSVKVNRPLTTEQVPTFAKSQNPVEAVVSTEKPRDEVLSVAPDLVAERPEVEQVRPEIELHQEVASEVIRVEPTITSPVAVTSAKELESKLVKELVAEELGEGKNPTQPTSSPTPESKSKVINNNPKITGDVSIDFRSRITPEESDRYSVNLLCGKGVRFKGEIFREPEKLSAYLKRVERPLQFRYQLALGILGGTAEKSAGTIAGVVSVTPNGLYDPRQLRLTSSLESGGQGGLFSGHIQGKSEGKSGILGATYTRLFGGKRVSIKLKQVDPLKFNGLRLAPGPSAEYQAVDVFGNLDYDYDTGNWITGGLRLQNVGGELDIITGSIKWNPDDKRESNGKGFYEVNLRYNEERYTKTADEGEFFENLSDEEAFFAVDPKEGSIPTLKGRITYIDSFSGVNEEGEPKVIASDVHYELEGDKLTDTQLVAFMKLWLLISGPVNDE